MDYDDDDDEVVVEKVDDREWGIAWKKYAAENGNLENIPTTGHLRKFLSRLRINLTEKSCDTLMLICKKKGQIPYVHLTTLKQVIKDALDKYTGLPVDQAIGGAIVEFNASAAGRKHRNVQSMQSMQAIVAASTNSLSHYATALGKIKESKQEKQRRKEQEKLKRQLKREKLYAKQHGIEYKSVGFPLFFLSLYPCTLDTLIAKHTYYNIHISAQKERINRRKFKTKGERAITTRTIYT